MVQQIDKMTIQRVENARKKLLDLTLRNSLLNFKHSERSASHIRIVNNNIDDLYNLLIGEREIEIVPLPELPTEPKDEKTTEFQNAFELALITDERYLEEKSKLAKRDEVDDDLEEKLIRELKNRVREQLGLSSLKSFELSKKEWAKENGIDPDYENNSTISDHCKAIVQTLLYPKEFKRKILALKRVIKSDREEKGTSTFYLALGFWNGMNKIILK